MKSLLYNYHRDRHESAWCEKHRFSYLADECCDYCVREKARINNNKTQDKPEVMNEK